MVRDSSLEDSVMDDLEAAFEALAAKRKASGTSSKPKGAAASGAVRTGQGNAKSVGKQPADSPKDAGKRRPVPDTAIQKADPVRRGSGTNSAKPAVDGSSKGAPVPPVGMRKASSAEKTALARRAIERQQPITTATDAPAKLHGQHIGAEHGYKGIAPGPFVPNPRTTADWPKKHAPGGLKEGDSVWYRNERWWVCNVPGSWEMTSYVVIVNEAWRPGGHVSKTAEVLSVHADLVELAPVKGPAWTAQPTKHAVDTQAKKKELGITHVGDDIGAMLQGKSLDEVYTIAAKYLGVPEKELRAKYSHMNPGQQRMNCGNRMRGWSKRKK